MTENIKKQKSSDEILLTAMMALLNVSIVAVISLAIWSVFSLVEQADFIVKFINGGFIR